MASQEYPVRVGRRVGSSNPKLPGYRSIVCLTPSTPYGDLGPYVLRTPEGYLMENVWQGSKVYLWTPQVREIYSRYDPRVIWERNPEVHLVARDQIPPGRVGEYIPVLPEQGEATLYLTPQYLSWRRDLFQAPHAVRYPVGYEHRHECQGTLPESELQRWREGKITHVRLLGYAEARRQLYVPLYQSLAAASPKIRKLVSLSRKGPLLIVEVDGPHQESLQYYVDTYGVDPDFIQDSTILATPANLDIMLRDTRHPYGHGYALAELVLRLR